VDVFPVFVIITGIFIGCDNSQVYGFYGLLANCPASKLMQMLMVFQL